MVGILIFDVYMALVEIKGGLVSWVSGVLGLNSRKAGEFVQKWRVKQMECEAISSSLDRGRIPFCRCTESSLD